jgi:outer membrane protein assembly factor BamB
MRPFTAISVSLLAATAVALAAEAEWPQFRGPSRDGVSSETGLLREWPEGGPAELWRKPLGNGYSAVSVSAGRLYTMFGKGADEFAGCHDAATGRELWRVRTDDAFKNMHGSGPRSTPTVDGEVVYVLSARGKLHALAVADGKSIWMRDLGREFGAPTPRWGHSTSALIEGDRLLLNVGGTDGSSIVALDKLTGKELWRSETDKAGYSTPIAVSISGRRQVVFFTGTAVVALAPETGRPLWRQPWKTSYDVNAAAPLFVPPDAIFVSSGYDVGSALYRVKSGETGTDVEEVWRSREMKNKFSSSVFRDGYVYGFDEKFLTCIVAATGEMRWQARGFGHGSLIYADGHLFVLGDKGTLALVEATPEEYRERARARVFDGKSWTMPSLAGGRLFLRDERDLVALRISK